MRSLSAYGGAVSGGRVGREGARTIWVVVWEVGLWDGTGRWRGGSMEVGRGGYQTFTHIT